MVRLLCYGERQLAKRHPLLQTLLNCRGDMDLGGYFGYCLTVDPVTGTRAKRVENWSMAGPTGTEVQLLHAALRMDLVSHDFYHLPGGVYPLKTAVPGTVYSPVHTADFWTRPECVIDYCVYMHTLVVSMGSAATVTAGFTFKTWGGSNDSFYIRHLRIAATLLNSEEQCRWLRFADEQMRGFITYASRTLRATILPPSSSHFLRKESLARLCPTTRPRPCSSERSRPSSPPSWTSATSGAGSALTPSASPSTPALSLVSPKSASVRLMTARLTPSPTTVRLTPSLTVVRLTPSLRTAVRLAPASRPSRPELSHPGRRLLAEAARSPPSRTSTACPPTRCSRDLEATLHNQKGP